MNILLTFTNISWQKGSAAQVLSFAEEIRQRQPGVRLTLLSHYPALDEVWAEKFGVEVRGFPYSGTTGSKSRSVKLLWTRGLLLVYALLAKAGVRLKSLIKNDIAAAYLQADLIADLSGDSFRDPPGGFSLAHNIHLLACLALNKKVVLVSQSIGPFRTVNKPLTRFVLNRCHLIYYREDSTFSILQSMGVQPDRMIKAPDVAFLLPVEGREAFERIAREQGIEFGSSQPNIGISVSNLMEKITPGYISLMKELCEHLHEKYKANIYLVPHEFRPVNIGRDDVATALKVKVECDSAPYIQLISRDLPPDDIKTFISQLDFFIASRMHAGIAALSSGVPCIMVSWSHKYLGLMQEIGLERYVFHPASEDHHKLYSLCEDVMNENSRIRQILKAYNQQTGEQIRNVTAAICQVEYTRSPAQAVSLS